MPIPGSPDWDPRVPGSLSSFFPGTMSFVPWKRNFAPWKSDTATPFNPELALPAPGVGNAPGKPENQSYKELSTAGKAGAAGKSQRWEFPALLPPRSSQSLDKAGNAALPTLGFAPASQSSPGSRRGLVCAADGTRNSLRVCSQIPRDPIHPWPHPSPFLQTQQLPVPWDCSWLGKHSQRKAAGEEPPFTPTPGQSSAATAPKHPKKPIPAPHTSQENPLLPLLPSGNTK